MVPQNIKLNNVRSLYAKLYLDEYFDFMLYKGEAYGISSSGECLATFIDFNDDDCYTKDGGVQSKVSWPSSINKGVEMKEIGWTSMDNGLINFDKDAIMNKEFVKLFFDSVLKIEESDTKFHMHPVDGNTKAFEYPISVEQENGKYYVACKGGFLQGFYKAYGYNYQVLPNVIEDEWQFDIELRPRSDYKTKDNILNNAYPENSGTFFYMGTRAENKFAELYNKTSAYTEVYDNKYITEYLLNPNDYYEYEYPKYTSDKDVDFFRTVDREDSETYLDDEGQEDEYYDYVDDNPFDDEDEDFFRSKLVEDIEKKSYLSEEKDISMSGISIDIDEDKIETVETDNKFLLFNRTCTGYTVSKWDRAYDKTKFNLVLEHREYKDNPFLIFNRTCTGYTAHDIDRYFEEHRDETDDYNIMQDVVGNAFSLQYNQDGSITYNYTSKDCSSEERYSKFSETTKPGVIKDGQWSTVTIKFKMLNTTYSECVTKDEYGNIIKTNVINNVGRRQMRMRIYVNGYLVFISKPLDEFKFRELNDSSDKQEGVPYNISLGGGTQGLGERIWLDYKRPVTSHYYLEKNYAGSFIGDIRSFKMYDCGQNYQTIKHNIKKQFN